MMVQPTIRVETPRGEVTVSAYQGEILYRQAGTVFHREKIKRGANVIEQIKRASAALKVGNEVGEKIAFVNASKMRKALYYSHPRRFYRRTQQEIQKSEVWCPKCREAMPRVRMDKTDDGVKWGYQCHECSFFIPEEKIVDSLADKVVEKVEQAQDVLEEHPWDAKVLLEEAQEDLEEAVGEINKIDLAPKVGDVRGEANLFTGEPEKLEIQEEIVEQIEPDPGELNSLNIQAEKEEKSQDWFEGMLDKIQQEEWVTSATEVTPYPTVEYPELKEVQREPNETKRDSIPKEIVPQMTVSQLMEELQKLPLKMRIHEVIPHIMFRNKKGESINDRLPGGLADDREDSDFEEGKIEEGMKIEKEHTEDDELAREIAKDHLAEDPNYYKKLKKMESSIESELGWLEYVG